MANAWREHAMLKARFLPDYPDDLQVVVHDGGPQITRNEPEVVWVENNCTEGNYDIVIGNEQYLLSGDGYLMPIKKDQPPPDLRYFKQPRR